MDGKEIKELRRASKMTQEELASRIGVATSTIYKWEANKSKPTKIGQMALARVAKEVEEKK